MQSVIVPDRMTFSIPRVPAPLLEPIGSDDLSTLDGDLAVSSSEDAS